MDKVNTIDEALMWFYRHHSGNVICVHDKTGKELECDCYPQAEEFYNGQGE